MTCGIYLLRFNNTDKVYIGQSKNIEKRYKDHLKTFCLQLASDKLLAAVEKYGIPTYEVLVECLECELDVNENESIEIWDSYDNGFNSRERASGGGRGAYGERNNRSKNSDEVIEEVFLLLASEKYTNKEIVQKTGIAIHIIHGISRGSCHTWLKNKYPGEYAKLESKRYTTRGSASQRGLSLPKIISPEGIEFTVDNIRNFAREHGLDYGALNKVLNKKPGFYSTKGWRVK